MKDIDAQRLKLAAMELVEGTTIPWHKVLRSSISKFAFIQEPFFRSPDRNYELALGIIEGKPVWAGDLLYRIDTGESVAINTAGFRRELFSWFPPKLKTAMVELLVEDIAAIAMCKDDSVLHIAAGPFVEACRKTLEQLK